MDILDQVNPSETRTHTYDALQRLKTGGTTTNAESYDYDLVGNRTASFLSSTHNHDDLNRLTEDDAFTYTYDNNGNLETKTNKATPTDITTYHWDAQDQLIQIDHPDSTVTTYKYDGLGRRIEKNVAGTITRYVYDGEDIALEYDGTNTFLARYSHGDQVDQPLILQKAGLGFFYYHSNHQGSITHLTDNSGNVANSYVYDSYGRRSQVIESVIQPYSYTGREFDVESGLYFYRARYLDANTGRFLSEDPIGFGGKDQNLYRYVTNNPSNWVDPFGLEVLLCRAPADVAYGVVDHHWIKTDTKEAGMGPADGGVPGNESNSPYTTETSINDHTGQSTTRAGVQCEKVENVDEQKVNEQLELGKDTGQFSAWNNCQTLAREILDQASTTPKTISFPPLNAAP